MEKTWVRINGIYGWLYDGITAVYGGWVLTTEGDPVNLNIMEMGGFQSEIDQINAILTNPKTPWEKLTKIDGLYIRYTLLSWGLLKEKRRGQ